MDKENSGKKHFRGNKAEIQRNLTRAQAFLARPNAEKDYFDPRDISMDQKPSQKDPTQTKLDFTSPNKKA